MATNVVSDLIATTMASDGVADAANWTVAAASMKTKVSDGVTAIHDQTPNTIVLVLIVLSVVYLVRRWKLRDALVIVAGYMMADVYMAVLHMFLDHPRSRECPVAILRELALDFQAHHKGPFGVVVKNHVSAIDLLNTLTLGVPLFWAIAIKFFRGKTMPPQIVLFALATACAGILAAFNHVCCHARTHHVPIPEVIKMAQDLGVLPSNEFHRTHHTPPHDCNFSFLVGGAPLYDFLYKKLQELVIRYYDVMSVLFVLAQPFVVSTFFAVGVLIGKAPASETKKNA